MATRSTITVVNPTTGEIKTIYCHWDGYPEHNGKLLAEHYDTFEKADRLVSMGAMSSLMPSIDESVFYYRDRGEGWDATKPRVYPDWDSFIICQVGEEFNYVHKDGQWYVHIARGAMVPLAAFEDEDMEY